MGARVEKCLIGRSECTDKKAHESNNKATSLHIMDEANVELAGS